MDVAGHGQRRRRRFGAVGRGDRAEGRLRVRVGARQGSNRADPRRRRTRRVGVRKRQRGQLLVGVQRSLRGVAEIVRQVRGTSGLRLGYRLEIQLSGGGLRFEAAERVQSAGGGATQDGAGRNGFHRDGGRGQLGLYDRFSSWIPRQLTATGDHGASDAALAALREEEGTVWRRPTTDGERGMRRQVATTRTARDWFVVAGGTGDGLGEKQTKHDVALSLSALCRSSFSSCRRSVCCGGAAREEVAGQERSCRPCCCCLWLGRNPATRFLV